MRISRVAIASGSKPYNVNPGKSFKHRSHPVANFSPLCIFVHSVAETCGHKRYVDDLPVTEIHASRKQIEHWSRDKVDRCYNVHPVCLRHDLKRFGREGRGIEGAVRKLRTDAASSTELVLPWACIVIPWISAPYMFPRSHCSSPILLLESGNERRG